MSKIIPQHSTSSEVSDLLASYGAGSLDPARHALVASHLLLKPENRGFVRAVENTIAAEVCHNGTVSPLARRDARLGAIFSSPLGRTRRPSPELTSHPVEAGLHFSRRDLVSSYPNTGA